MAQNPLGDRYQLGDTLGFGGMSEVHRGRDVRLGRDVAIKVLRADLARDPTFQTRFKREAQNAASLNHPAIVSVYDTGEMVQGGVTLPYIVMEYVDGETLRDIVKREGPLSAKRAMEITADICAALDFSHRHGIIHRDVKPANVMLTRAGAVKVMDFGIARAVTDGQATVTATAAVIGTAQYLSPEQARGEAVDARSDVYAAGCVLYELLTGNPPFSGDSPVAVAYQHVREEPRPPSAIVPSVTHELDAIVLKALNKNPMNRYQTAADMRSDLVRALSGQAVHATPVMNDADRTALIGSVPAVPASQAVVGARGRAVVTASPSILQAQAQEQWDDPEARNRRVWGFVGIGAVCLILLAGAILLTLKITGAPGPATQVPVPSLLNMTQEEATALLRDKGLTVADAVKNAPSDNASKGKVIDQDPSAGVPVNQGSAVTLTIGSGVEQVTVPNVQAMEAQRAQSEIQKVDLVYKEELVYSNTVKGRVDRQDPDPGTEVAPGSTVTVFISQGTQSTVVPDASQLIGVPKDQAEAALTAAQLKWVEQTTQSDQPKDQVIALGGVVKPGDQVQVDTVITLMISDNSMMKMPQLVNLSPDEALAKLTADGVGWTGNAQNLLQQSKPVPDQALWGRIVDQLPKAGDMTSKNTPVQVSIGVEPKIAVPDMSGMTKDQAAAALKDAGWKGQLTVVDDGGPAPSPDLAGTVVPGAQDPAANTEIKMTDPVTIHTYAAANQPPGSGSNPPGGGGGNGGGGNGGGGG
jgi:serine/threonine-protein kinase